MFNKLHSYRNMLGSLLCVSSHQSIVLVSAEQVVLPTEKTSRSLLETWSKAEGRGRGRGRGEREGRGRGEGGEREREREMGKRGEREGRGRGEEEGEGDGKEREEGGERERERERERGKRGEREKERGWRIEGGRPTKFWFTKLVFGYSVHSMLSGF